MVHKFTSLWGNNRRFNAYPDYIKKTFGGRMQKLTLDAGFTCPNRDGTKGSGGCTFCLNDAFNPSYCTPSKSIEQQVEEGIQFHKSRYRRANGYLAYFQAYTNTYAPLEKLKSLYTQALSISKVRGLVIGTRPDCIDDDILDYLSSLAKDYYIIVEYGIESVYDKTLKRINRCHSFSEAVEAIQKTADRGIHTGGHLIFGLPGESSEEMLKSVKIISGLPLTSVKFHQLQIFRGTPMEKEFFQHPGDFNLFDQNSYLDFMVEYISRLNPSFVVERIAGETPPRNAVLKPWGPRYDQLLAQFEQKLEQTNSWQGKYHQ